MALSLYSHNSDSFKFNDTPVYGSCNFQIALAANGIGKKYWPSINGRWLEEIHGIADDTIAVSYSISWEEGPGANMIKKIKEFTTAEAFKLFGGAHVDSNVATDTWTQKFPKDGSYISANIKFRAYRRGNGYANSSSYLSIIQFLTYGTSPLHEFQLSTELDNIKNSLANSKAQGKDLADKLNSLKNNQTIENIDAVSKSVDAINETFKGLGNSSRGNITFEFSFGKLFIRNPDIDWIIKSWDYTPSIQHDEDIYPLWCDFNVDLETNQKLTNTDLWSITHKVPMNTANEL